MPSLAYWVARSEPGDDSGVCFMMVGSEQQMHVHLLAHVFARGLHIVVPQE
jgi:hypothetical protein